MAEEGPQPATPDAPEPTAPAPPARRRIRRDPTRARASAPARARQWRDRAPVPLAICAIVAPELFGGAFGWSVAVIAALASFAALAIWLAYRRELAAIPAPVPLVVAFGALGWTVIQALPLPFFLARSMAPKSADAVAMTAHAAGLVQPAFCALTRDPGGTSLEIVKGTAIVACLAAAWALANVGRRDIAVRIAAVSVTVMALVGAAHLALGETAIFGFYNPPYSGPRVPAPLWNGNHMGGFLAMGTPLLLVLGAEARLPAWRIACFLSAAACTVLCVLTLSRGGIASLVVGVIALAAVVATIRNKRSDSSRRRAVPWLVVGIATAAVAAAYIGADAFLVTMRDHDLSKLHVAASTLRLAADAPVLGVGRGAFSAAYVAQDGPLGRYVVPENLPAQWAVEWGFPIAIALAGVLSVRLARSVLVTRNVVRGAAAAAIIAIVAHDLVDFSLEMCGIAVVAAVVLAAALAPDHEREGVPPDRGRYWPSLATVLIAVFGCAVIAVAGLSYRIVGTTVPELQARLTRDMQRGNDGDFRPTLDRALALHPSEPAFPLLAGAAAADRGDNAAAARWLTRAMQLAPNWASPHVAAAMWLWRTGRLSQAVLEIREAAERDPGQARELSCHLARATRDARVVLRAAPAGDSRMVFLDHVAPCLPPDQAAIIDRELVSRSPHLASALERQARRDLEAGRVDAAVTTMRDVVHRTPEDIAAETLFADALIAAHRPREAAAALAEAARGADDPAPILEQEARANAAAGDDAAMRRCIEQLRGLAGGSSRRLGAAMMLLGDLELSRGNGSRALHAYDEANRFDPASGGLRQVATLAESAGDLRGAFRAYAQLCEDEGPGSPACVARDRLAGTGAEPPIPLGQPSGGPAWGSPDDPSVP